MNITKSLSDFLIEARETVGKLPFTQQQFREFIKAVDDFDDESDIWKTIEGIVTDTYGEKVWRGFLGWCEGTQYGSNPDDMYMILQNMPKARLQKVLGAGSYGAAVELANGMVCKIYHKNREMERTDKEFFEYCMKHKTDVFPTVHKLGPNYVVMEKLKMETPKCRLYDKYLGYNGVKIDGKMTMEQIAKQVIKKDKKITKLVAKLSSEEKEILDWAVDALTRLEEAVGFDSFSDMRLANIGERNDGAIIWFDI